MIVPANAAYHLPIAELNRAALGSEAEGNLIFGVLVDLGCAAAISGFTVGSNRAVSALVSTVADEAVDHASGAAEMRASRPGGACFVA